MHGTEVKYHQWIYNAVIRVTYKRIQALSEYIRLLLTHSIKHTIRAFNFIAPLNAICYTTLAFKNENNPSKN